MSVTTHIPFRHEFKNRMLTGKKIATSRTKRYGMAGDRFNVFGQDFEILSCERVMLGDVAKIYHSQEGFPTPEAFLELWAEIHPKAKFDLTKPVWLHRFKMVDSSFVTKTRDKP